MQSSSGKVVEKLGDAYVDNTMLMYVAQGDSTGNKNETRTEVIKQITKTAQNFEKKIFCMGGELSLQKSY